MTSKQIQFTEHEKQEPSRSEPLPIPTAKESRSYSFSHEKHYIISSSVPNDPKFPPESFVHSKPLDDSSIRSKLHGENGREEEKSRRLRATTSYREMKLLNKFRSDESLVPSATTPPPPRSRHEKKKRAYSTFGDPSDRKLDDSESDNDEQLNTPEDKKIQTTKKSKSPKDQKLKREGSSKKDQKELKKLNETAKEFFEMRNTISLDLHSEKTKKDSAEKIFLRKIRHQIEHLPEPKVRRKKNKLTTMSVDFYTLEASKYADQALTLQTTPKSSSPRDTKTNQAIASLKTLACVIDMTNSEHEEMRPSQETQPRHFGRPLLESLQLAESEKVPHIVKMSCLYLREKGLSAVGIFRISRNRTDLLELKRQIDEGKRLIFNEMDISVYDVADLLKMYLRELPEPPIPRAYYSEFLNISRCPKEEQTTENVVQRLIELLRKLPIEAQDLLYDVVGLLHAIAANSDVNKMNAKNLAVVVVPCIIRTTETTDFKKMVEELSYAETSFTYLITYYKDVFSFVVERQLQTKSNLFAKSSTAVSESSSTTGTNEQETKSSSASVSFESTTTSSLIQSKNVGVTGFGKQILELEKEITDLESELFANKEEPTSEPTTPTPTPTPTTPTTSESLSSTSTPPSRKDPVSQPTTLTNETDSLLLASLRATSTLSNAFNMSMNKSPKSKMSVPPIVINDAKQTSTKLSTSPRKDNSPGTKERDSHTTTEGSTDGSPGVPSSEESRKRKEKKLSPHRKKTNPSSLSPSLQRTKSEKEPKSEKTRRKKSSSRTKSLSGEFSMKKDKQPSSESSSTKIDSNESTLSTNTNTTSQNVEPSESEPLSSRSEDLQSEGSTSAKNDKRKHILIVEQPKTITLIVEQWSNERNNSPETVSCYLYTWPVKVPRRQTMTQLVQKVIVHAQAISNLLKSPDFDPGALKDNIYAVVSFSKEFSRYLRNEQHRKLISLRIRTLLEKAIEMLQNLSTNTASNRDSVLILTATTELLRALTFAINNSK